MTRNPVQADAHGQLSTAPFINMVYLVSKVKTIACGVGGTVQLR